jgi:hypothetical protein
VQQLEFSPFLGRFNDWTKQLLAVVDPGGMEGYIPTGLKHRGLERSLYVQTANFFVVSRRLLSN